jgi:hypothetical protein
MEAQKNKTDSLITAAKVSQRCVGRTRMQQVKIQEQAIADGEEFLEAAMKVLREHKEQIPACQNRIKAISDIHLSPIPF